MRSSQALRRAALAAVLSVSFLLQGTWALAATTGGISGVVHDDTGAPIAGATVTATSPSQVASTTTDAQGHFVFLVLQPDTYTLTITKAGYQTTAIAGNTVFADQTQQVILVAPRAIKVIAHVTGNAGGLVKPGVSGDIYNVTPAQQAASVALGGGGNMNSAYSAIASVPGVFLGTGESGWDQNVVIHGQDPSFTSFEVEGIPVNRAFDNYPSSTESSLGLEELQIYTGGGPSDITSNGVSGFINSVIKTGTYPGFANVTVGTASEAFWHLATLEAGGATSDRNFSYYVGISGYDQEFRYVDNDNGASYMEPGDVLQGTDPYFTNFTSDGRGVVDNCPESNPYPYPAYTQPSPGATETTPPGCNVYGWELWGDQESIADRENVINLHFAIPRADGQRDDIQALWWDSALQTQGYQGIAMAGPGLAEGENYLGLGAVNAFSSLCENLAGTAGCVNPVTGNSALVYPESYNYNLPFGTNVAPGGVAVAPSFYGASSDPVSDYGNGCAGTIYTTGDSCFLPTNDSTLSGDHNDVSALKLQWTHPFSDTSYLRVFAYSMYSDWLNNDPIGIDTEQYYEPFYNAPDYELDTHTVGGSLSYADQITDTNLFSFEGNLSTAGTIRYNSYGGIYGYQYGGSEIGLVAPTGACTSGSGVHYSTCYNCYDQAGLYGAAGGQIPCYITGYEYGQTGSEACYPDCPLYDTSEYNYDVSEPGITGAAAAAGAEYMTLWDGNTTGDYNSVRPLFWNFSLHDQWRPNDKWLFDAALRYDDFTEDLANGVNPADDFEAQIIDDDVCWNPTLGVATVPLLPGEYPPAAIAYSTTCTPETIGTKTYNFIHPPFTDANVSGNEYTTYDWEPRFGFTYTQNSNTVWTFSTGRYAEPAVSAADQYLFTGGGSFASSTWANFLDQGFFSPEHEIPNMTSAQYNLSYEHRFSGTNLSMKIAPFYELTSNWEEDVFIGEDYVTEYQTGRAKNYGVEFSLQDGDFNANGLSAMFSFTWTEALVQYQPLLGLNQIAQMNTAIADYNSLTKAGGGFACYAGSTSASPTTDGGACGSTNTDGSVNNIANPYYSQPEQALLNQNGWYAQGDTALSAPADENNAYWYNSPYVANLVLNWRKNRFSITPSLQFQAGTPYGSPFDVTGVDPRDCAYSQDSTGIDPGNDACDYTTAGIGAGPYGYFYVPNPQTGTFASPGEYSEPNIIMGNLQLSYDLPHVKLTLTATDLWHRCFGGTSEAWTTAYPPSSVYCAYFPNDYYNGSGWYNGSSPYDKAANFVTPYQWEEESYTPSFSNNYNGYIPFNLYIQAQIHL